MEKHCDFYVDHGSKRSHRKYIVIIDRFKQTDSNKQIQINQLLDNNDMVGCVVAIVAK